MKKTMKHGFIYMVILTMLLGLLSGCGNNENASTEDSSQSVESESVETDSEDESSTESTTELDTQDSEQDDSNNIETESLNSEEKNPETQTPSESESTTPSNSESTNSEATKEKYTYKELNKTMYATSSVNVRSTPSSSGKKLGSLSEGQAVTVTGQCKENSWYRIKFDNQVGYVSNSYLTDTKPSSSDNTTSDNTGSNNTSSNNTSSNNTSSNNSSSNSSSSSSGTTSTTKDNGWDDVPNFSSSKYANYTAEQMAQIVVDCIIDDSMSEFEKAISIHDWLTFNVDYDYTYSKYDAINAFRDRTCVCQGYAQAFEMMVELVGIEATFVGGTGTNSSGKTESHAWNQVKISGTWYNVDVTWDDPASAGKDPDDHSGNRYDYFLISDSELEKDHVAEDYYEDKHTCSKSYDRKTIFKYAINSGVHEDAAFVETLADMNAAIKQYMNAEKTEFWMWYYNTSLTSSNCATYLQNEMTKASYFATISKYYYPEDGVTKCLVSITPMSEWNKIPVVTNVNEFTALLDKNGDAGVTTYTIRYEASSGTPEVAATAKYGLSYSYYSYNDGKSMLMTVTIK